LVREQLMSSTGFSGDQRRVLPVILVPAFMSLLSVSIVNVTLPAIETTLDTGTSGLQWIVSGYALVFGVLLVSAGRAGDIWGRGKLFVAGLVVFGLGSLLAGLAPSILVLNLARVVMGLGSGLLNPQVTGMIQQFFSGELRGRAFGLFGGVLASVTA
jgi:MFS family permease